MFTPFESALLGVLTLSILANFWKPVAGWFRNRSKAGPNEHLVALVDIHSVLVELRDYLIPKPAPLDPAQGNQPIIERLDKVIAIWEPTAAQISEFVVAQRAIMRAMVGSGGTQDDELWERARALREQYPELTHEQAMQRARTASVYAGR